MKQLVGKLIARFVFALLVFAAGRVWAADWYGNGSDTLWSTVENWNGNALPASNANLAFRYNSVQNRTATLDDLYTYSGNLHVGLGSSADAPYIFEADDPEHGLVIQDDIWFGYWEDGWLWLKSGTYTFSEESGKAFHLGEGTGDHDFWLRVGDGASAVTLTAMANTHIRKGSTFILDNATFRSLTSAYTRDFFMYSTSSAYITNSTMDVAGMLKLNNSSKMVAFNSTITVGNYFDLNDSSLMAIENSTMTFGQNACLYGSSSMTMENSTATFGFDFNVGNDTGANCSFSGSFVALKLTNWGYVFNVGAGANSTGIVENIGGDWSSYYLRLGNGSGATGEFTQTGESLTLATELSIGYGGNSTGAFTLNGGTVTADCTTKIANGSGSTGTLNVNGGTFATKNINVTGTGNLNLGSATLKALQAGTFVADGIDMRVGGDAVIDTGNKAITIATSIADASGASGSLSFKGGNTITLSAGCSYTGGTAIELGTKVVDGTEEAQAKAAILDHGLLVDGRARLSATDYTVFECSGGLTDADIANVTFTNCYEGTAAKVVDGTKLVVTLVAPPCVNTSNSIKVFSGMTLGAIAYAKFSSRFCGSYVGEAFDAIDSAKGYNKRLNKDGNGNLTSVVVEFQIVDGQYTKCVVVEFTDDGADVYAKALGARYVENQPIGYLFYDETSLNGSVSALATSPDAAGYGVCDIRVTVDGAMLWTLDQDRAWSELRNGATLSPDSAVRILVTGNSPVLTIDENVDVAKIEFMSGVSSGVSTNSIAVSDGVTVAYGAIELDENVCLLSDGFDAAFVALSPTSTLLYSSGETVFNSTVSGLGVVEVAPNATLYVDGDVATSIRLLNNGTVVKRIAEVVSIPFYNGSTGVTIVSNGTLKAANYAGSGSSHVVRVVSGATFDMNGIMDVNVIVRLEEGAHFVNTGSSIDSTKSQAVQLILEGDAAATASKDFGLLNRNYASTSLDLGSHALELDGAGAFWLVNTTIVGSGTIAIENGSLQCTRGDSSGSDCTVNVGSSGVLCIDGTRTLSVKNFFNGGRLDSGILVGGTNYGTLQVMGTLTTGNALTNLTLAAGATVKMTGTAQIVSGTFSASGTIAVDASEISAADLRNATDGRIPVLTVPTAQVPVGVSWVVTNDPLSRSRLRWEQNGDGASTLYLCKHTGLVFIVM